MPHRRALLLCMLMTLVIGMHSRAGRPASAQSERRAGLIVQFGDGSTTQRCVRFSEDALTGEELMRRARMPAIFEYSSLGPAVCKIGNEGCDYPAEGCFCQCQTLGASCTFWNYLQKTDSGWRPLPTGAGARIVQDGMVVAWSWAVGDGESVSTTLPDVSIDQICSAPAAAAPAVTAQPATTLAPSATAPPLSTNTPAPPTETPVVAAPTETVAPPTAAPTAMASATAAAVAAVAPTAAAVATSTAPRATTPAATATSAPVPAISEETTSNSTNYIAFGVIALVLGSLVFVARRARRTA